MKIDIKTLNKSNILVDNKINLIKKLIPKA